MDFSLDELIGCPAKKRKRDRNEAMAKKTGTAVVGEVPASLKGIVEEAPGLPTMEPEVGDPIEEMELLFPLQWTSRWQR